MEQEGLDAVSAPFGWWQWRDTVRLACDIARSGVPSDLWDSKELWERVLHIILERKHFQES